ncbi:hypothetical protein AFCA_013357 [Aspergillus flavus]|nr:hypothetical protein AFLA70_453g000641 [Aspergillus flavus AF70]UDD63801.1 hypothetical protein AFCA_013357 [Aspergillus flavus]
MRCNHQIILKNAETTSYAEYVAAHCSVGIIRTLAGASSGIASSIVTCPLDVVKTRLQAQGGFRHKSISTNIPFASRGLLGVGHAVWHEKGLKGMYQGLGPTLLGHVPRWAIFFSTYHRSCEIFHACLDLESQWVSSLMASATAGTCSIVATIPIQFIKTRLMSQTNISSQTYAMPKWQYKSAFDAAQQIYRNEGILAFYSGLTPALLGLSQLAIQFPLYETLKRGLTGSGLGEIKDCQNKTSGIIAAGFLSKIVSTSLAYPHEVIRTRLQTQQILKSSTPLYRRYTGIVQTARTIWLEEGWHALYAGFGTNLMRAVPASIATMLVYENMLSKLTELKANGERKLGW